MDSRVTKNGMSNGHGTECKSLPTQKDKTVTTLAQRAGGTKTGE